MKRLSQAAELTANVLIVAVALLLGVVLVQKHFIDKPGVTNGVGVQPVLGSTVNLPNVDWSKHSKTLVLALQTHCRFCNESAPFYRRVIEVARQTDINLVAVFPTSKEENTNHLQQLGLAGMDVRQASLNTLKVSGTPTLILANSKGEITNFWLGKLPPDKELDVLNQLTKGD